MKTITFGCLLLVAPPLAWLAAGQNALDDARAKYEAAAYEEALATLTRVDDDDSDDRVLVEQYRALCLIALGNLPAAERAVAALVAADPTYVPSSSVASPKVLSLIADIRRKEVPVAARRLLEEGRRAFEAKDLAGARQDFELLLKLLDDPAMAGQDERDELLVLAQGFMTLTSAAAIRPAGPAEKLAPVAAAQPNEPAPAAANDKAAADSAATSAAKGTFVPAVPIDQRLPAWEPPTASVAQAEYSGKLRVRIGADGTVVAATIDEVSHPAYDARLLQVAPGWRYQPASRDGAPVESERVIAITLRAQR